jgi:hypothetical protein
MPTKDLNKNEMMGMLDEYFDHIKILPDDFVNKAEWDMLDGLAPSSMYDPATGKTRLMREFWSKDVSFDEPYMGKRTTVLTHPGSTRDALVGTPSTVARVKVLNNLARVISEKSPHSANASGSKPSDRYLRVLKRHWFLHLDFKKYGLTFPRTLTNAAIEVICHRAGIDDTDFVINEFFVEIDGELFETERGTALGWMDAINALVVNAILWNLSAKIGFEFDFLGFNDDFELSFWESGDMRTHLNAIREALFIEFDYWDIPLSADKIFGSRASVFLENYSYFDLRYGLNMDKSQLAVASYASSLIALSPTAAKIAFATAWSAAECDYARERCMSTLAIEFEADEIHMPLQFGGWYHTESPTLDEGLMQASMKFIHLGSLLTQLERPKYSSEIRKVTPPDKMRVAIEKRTQYVHSAAMYRATIANPGTLDEINLEASLSPNAINLLMEVYCGRSAYLADAMIVYAAERSSGRQPPPLSRRSEASGSS